MDITDLIFNHAVPIFIIVVLVTSIGAYFSKCFSTITARNSNTSIIDLATASATVGGFILFSAFYKEGSDLAPELKEISRLLLSASVCLFISFFLMEALSVVYNHNPRWLEDTLAYTAVFFIAISCVSLGFGLYKLLMVIQKL